MFDKLLGFLKIQKFSSELQLLDGTLIRIDGIFGDADVPVNLVTSDGLKPLPDGDYPLGGDYEGTIITVKDGIIVDFNKVDPEAVDNPDEIPVEDPVKPELAVDTTTGSTVSSDIVAPLAPFVESTYGSGVEIVPSELLSLLETIIKRIDVLEGKNTNMSTELSTMNTLLEKMDGAKPLEKNIVPVNDPLILDNPRYNAIKNKNKK